MGAGDIQKFEAAYVKEVQVAESNKKTHSLAVRLFVVFDIFKSVDMLVRIVLFVVLF